MLSGRVPIKQSYDKLLYCSCMFSRNICLVKLAVMEEIYCTMLNILIYKNPYSCFPKGGGWETTGSRALPKFKIHKSVLKFSDFTNYSIFLFWPFNYDFSFPVHSVWMAAERLLCYICAYT